MKLWFCHQHSNTQLFSILIYIILYCSRPAPAWWANPLCTATANCCVPWNPSCIATANYYVPRTPRALSTAVCSAIHRLRTLLA